jgi:hypothetical protein
VTPLRITETVLRDAHQSLLATRMRTDDMIPIAEKLDAVGYHSRAFVSFGMPIPLANYDPESRRDLVGLTHQVQDQIGLLYKVLPTALVAAAWRPKIGRTELGARIDELLAVLAAEGANLGVRTGARAVDEGVPPLIERGVLVDDRRQLRVRDRIVLRYYARTIQHLIHRPRRTTH